MLLQREAQSFDKGAPVLFLLYPPGGRILWFLKKHGGLGGGGSEGGGGREGEGEGGVKSSVLRDPVITPALTITLSLSFKIAVGLHLE